MSDDLSKTMIIPNPGGRLGGNAGNKGQAPAPQSPQQSPPPQQFNAAPAFSDKNKLTGENRLLASCNDILVLAGNVRSLEPNNTIEQLRIDVDRLIMTFTNELEKANVAKEVVLTGRYIICCLLDELILSTPWGSESIWSHQTLLGKYHNETWGGEKFFLIINKLLENPSQNIELIELCYVCLSVGFAGKYKVSQQGQTELARISQILLQQIENHKPVDRDLSPQWVGIGNNQEKFSRRIPAWLVACFLGFIMVGVYVALLSNIKSKVDPLYQDLELIGWQDYVVSIEEKESVFDINKIAATLRRDLSPEIQRKILEIDVRDERALIRLTSSNLFGSGSSQVNLRELPELNRFVDILSEYCDSIIVVGHTDNTGKADSNWVISRKRAEALAMWLDGANKPLSNIITRGVADTQPLYDNDSALNRSLNRRVELVLILKGNN